MKTKPVKGSVKIVDENNRIIKSDRVVDYSKENIKEVEYILNQQVSLLKFK